MNTKLIGSGTRCFGMIDSLGNIPWLHWAIFRNFLIEHIKEQSIIISGDSFQDPLFQDFLSTVCAKVTVVSQANYRKSSNVFVCNNPQIALASATDSTPDVVIIADNHLSEILFQTVFEIRYLQVDMNLSSPSLSFPKINTEKFEKVSWMSSREEIWHMDCNSFQSPPRQEVNPIEFQHWLPKKKKSLSS